MYIISICDVNFNIHLQTVNKNKYMEIHMLYLSYVSAGRFDNICIGVISLMT